MPPLFSLHYLTEWILFHEYSTGCSSALYYIVSACDCQCPVAPQAYVKRFHPQHLGVSTGFKPSAIVFFGRRTKGGLTAPICRPLLAVHPQCFNTTTTVQRVCVGRTRALTFRVDHNYNSLLKFQRQPTKLSLFFRRIVCGIASVTYRAIYEI